ncbi:hypothetical protein SKAU_G00381320 [Synaphobranchus kaupii]|uniref:Uncharacterized protein n=1 Tax=Synaphobranchus kaupii TaxID=118154 RepID=A0A9Q1EDS4_SYNKA|nr:hypothetical protein SKAU_G00381320 [Synaphobranchus kaupii]
MLWLPTGLRPLTRGTASFLLALLQSLSPKTLDGMYATHFYRSGGRKPGRRPGMVGAGLPVLENHHHALPPPPHPHAPLPQNYLPPMYQGRLDGHRAHFQSHHHYHQHPQSHPAPPHYHAHPHANLHQSRKKTWNFIHEKMSYDTFFTMKRLIERSHGVDEVLRWVTQNPGKISYNHYPIALQKIGQLLQVQQAAGAGPAGGRGSEGALASPTGLAGPGESHYREISEQQDFQTLCNAIVNDCAKFNNFSIVNCLYAVAALVARVAYLADCRPEWQSGKHAVSSIHTQFPPSRIQKMLK